MQMPGWAPRLRPEGGHGGLRLTCGPSDDGGREEFCEFCWSCACTAPTCASQAAMRCSYPSTTIQSAAWISSGIRSHSSLGSGGSLRMAPGYLSELQHLFKFET